MSVLFDLTERIEMKKQAIRHSEVTYYTIFKRYSQKKLLTTESTGSSKIK